MKLGRIIPPLLLLMLAIYACGTAAPAATGESPILLQNAPAVSQEIQGIPSKNEMIARCLEIGALYRDSYLTADKLATEDRWSKPSLSQSDVDLIEESLLAYDFPVLDSSDARPSYLAAGDRFSEFWERVQRCEPAQQELISLSRQGFLSYSLFSYSPLDQMAYFQSICYDPELDDTLSYELHTILDWEFTEKGNFYYAIRPAGDKHYERYTLIRTVAPDEHLWSLTRQYISPIGYIATNLFLTEWSETGWNELSFNDVWEHLFRLEYHKEYTPREADHIPQTSRYRIASEAFEAIMLKYFRIEQATLQANAYYQRDEDCYLWQPMDAYDFAFISYYAYYPEVTAACYHPDGTITLTVEVLSTDLKTDCLFAHQVTIRTLDNGRFQYVANSVTNQSEYGLPFCAPRLTWEAQ